MPNETQPKSKSESGHAKFLESWNKLIAQGATLDEGRLNPPPELKIGAMQTLSAAGLTALTQVGDSRANWRTVTQDRRADADQLEKKATRAVALLESRGASAETVEDARFYTRKLQGIRKEPKPVVDPNAPAGANESDNKISVSQQSNAARIATFNELIDFLEAQPEYAGVTNAGFRIGELRAFSASLQIKHDLTITAAATLSSDRIERNRLFYNDANSILALSKRYKKLVYGEYGTSDEYKAINDIHFKKPNL